MTGVKGEGRSKGVSMPKGNPPVESLLSPTVFQPWKTCQNEPTQSYVLSTCPDEVQNDKDGCGEGGWLGNDKKNGFHWGCRRWRCIMKMCKNSESPLKLLMTTQVWKWLMTMHSMHYQGWRRSQWRLELDNTQKAKCIPCDGASVCMHTRLKQFCNHPTCAKLVANKKRARWKKGWGRCRGKKQGAKRKRDRNSYSTVLGHKEKEIEHSNSTVLVSRTLRL